MGRFQDHFQVQQIAKRVLSALGSTLDPSDTEASIAARAVQLLSEEGISETWYYNCPAFVLLGSRSCVFISGRDYVPGCESLGEFNLVTVDISPVRNGAWGDCARTFPVEHGVCATQPVDHEFQEGLIAMSALHSVLADFVTPKTTFEELFSFGNAELLRLGFENLDRYGNLGHSIESNRDDRIYIEAGNSRPLGSSSFFTFEPHIRRLGGNWGFKHEDIYYFDSHDRLKVL